MDGVQVLGNFLDGALETARESLLILLHLFHIQDVR